MIKLKQILLEEVNITDSDIKNATVGDLKVAIEQVKKLKNRNDIIKYAKTGGKVGKILLNLFTGGLSGTILDTISTAADVSEVFKDIFNLAKNLPDNKTKNTILSLFDIDDNYAAMLDNNVEKEFAEYLSTKVFSNMKVNDSDKLIDIINANLALRKWLTQKFAGKTVAPELKGGFDLQKGTKINT